VARGETGQPQHRGVALENLGERFADDGAVTGADEPLRRMLARRAAAEVVVDDQD
jgi:hypothetical protein